MSFEIDQSADLTDGLQSGELAGTGEVFRFDGREVGTGRYHPPLIQLSSDGTGRLRNSNNEGGINPFTGVEVGVEIGQEYRTELTFTPAVFMLATPEPGTAALLGLGLLGLAVAQRTRVGRDD